MAEWILSDTYLHFTLLWRDFCRRDFGQEGFGPGGILAGGILVRRDFGIGGIFEEGFWRRDFGGGILVGGKREYYRKLCDLH